MCKYKSVITADVGYNMEAALLLQLRISSANITPKDEIEI